MLLSGWKIAMLVAHFNLFWHTLDLLAFEDWSFGDFLFVMAGPILMFFSVTSLLESGEGAEAQGARGPGEAALPVPARFFGILCLVQVWTVLVDLLYGGGFESMTAITLAVGVTLLVVALYRTPLSQTLVSVLIWLVFAGTVVLRSSGVID